ncbi:MAG: hypothetical protein MR411_02825 [Tenericutes bacterium]|nr:hypothetical protein [Mycoplasmatota bacterium]
MEMLKNKNRLIILLNYFIVFIIFIYVNNKYYDINNILTIVLGNNITSKSLFIERSIYLYHLFINIFISLVYFDNKLNYNMEFINLRKKIKNYFLEIYLNINVKNILINIISVIIISILFIKFKGIMSFNIFYKLLIFILFNITISNILLTILPFTSKKNLPIYLIVFSILINIFTYKNFSIFIYLITNILLFVIYYIGLSINYRKIYEKFKK